MEVILRCINGGCVPIETEEELREALKGARPLSVPYTVEQEYGNHHGSPRSRRKTDSLA